jgi:deoxyadenosine/deoxycytidine kinase
MKTGTDLLKLFYQENERWSFAFENMVQLSRLKTFYDSKKFIESFDNSQNNELNKEIKHRVFLERSIFSSFNVFALNSYEEKRLNQIEFDILDKYYKFFIKKSYKNVNNINSILNVNNQNCENELKFASSPLCKTSKSKSIPFQIIYIRTDPDVCYERLKKRDRESEVTISLDYLRSIHLKYEKWVNGLKENNQTNIIIINGNLSKEMVLAQVDQLISD